MYADGEIAPTVFFLPSGSRRDADGPDILPSALKWPSAAPVIPVVSCGLVAVKSSSCKLPCMAEGDSGSMDLKVFMALCFSFNHLIYTD